MRLLPLLSLLSCFLAANAHASDNVDQSRIRTVIENAIRPVMQQYGVPGIAIAVTINGERYFFNEGVASKESRRPVTHHTLFEIGSISKTLTATLASHAQVDGQLSLTDSVGKYLPSLRGSAFGNISLLHLGTHTSGGLPLQVTDEIRNNGQLMAYLRHWRPAHDAGTRRTYSNLDIGMLGMVAATSMRLDFDDAMEGKLFPSLGMMHTFLNVPRDQMKDYAQGYSKADAPVRLKAGVLGHEAYGVKSDSTDMIRFVEANMQVIPLEAKLQRAITDTHLGYFRAGDMTQDLIWEQYPYPVELKQVLAGNSDAMVYEPTAVAKLDPTSAPEANVLINKTGSTNGFAGYVAFIPAKKTGIVILANKNYPIAARVTAALRILAELDDQAAPAANR